jgi:hypothetical protein
MKGRSRTFDCPAPDYQAVFRTDDDVYDLGHVLFLAKRLPNPYELEYELWTPVGWRRTSHTLLEYTTLPISEEEFQLLSAEFLAGQHPQGSVEVDEMLRRWPH